MDFFENDYALPIILGNCKESIGLAKLIRKKLCREIHIFSNSISFIYKTVFRFHKIPSSRDEIAFFMLSDYAESLHEYYNPILIYCKEHHGEFISKYSNRLADRYILVSTDEIKRILDGGKDED